MNAELSLTEKLVPIVSSYTMMALLVLAWAAVAVALLFALLKKKAWNYEYTRKDRISYGLNWALLGFMLCCCFIFWASGFFETEGWRRDLSNVLCILVCVLPPLTVWSIAGSISARKEGRSRRSFLLQFSTVPVYLLGLILCWLLLK